MISMLVLVTVCVIVYFSVVVLIAILGLIFKFILPFTILTIGLWPITLPILLIIFLVKQLRR